PSGDGIEQIKFAQRVKSEAFSVRATEQAVKSHIESVDADLLPLPADATPATRGQASPPEQLAALEQDINTPLGTQVAISQIAKGKGKVTIQFANAEEFERLRILLRGSQQSEWTTSTAA